MPYKSTRCHVKDLLFDCIVLIILAYVEHTVFTSIGTTMNILTPQRLLHISSYKKLNDLWFLITTVTLTVCNRPQEIPGVYHYLLQTRTMNRKPTDSGLFTDINSMMEKFEDIKNRGNLSAFDPYVTKDKEMSEKQIELTNKLKESILKTAALSGLPKAINALMILKDYTPQRLRPQEPLVPFRRKMEDTNLGDIVKEQERGRAFWQRVYGKISGRVVNQMNSSYPDLWEYTIQHVYSPLLSYTGVLTAQETSLIVVACLIPQDVNPQLKGHLKGALNNGVDLETIREARQLAIEVAIWCGSTWSSEVAKL